MGESAKAAEITKLVRAALSNGGDCPVLAISQFLYQLLHKGQIGNVRATVSRLYPQVQIG